MGGVALHNVQSVEREAQEVLEVDTSSCRISGYFRDTWPQVKDLKHCHEGCINLPRCFPFSSGDTLLKMEPQGTRIFLRFKRYPKENEKKPAISCEMTGQPQAIFVKPGPKSQNDTSFTQYTHKWCSNSISSCFRRSASIRVVTGSPPTLIM